MPICSNTLLPCILIYLNLDDRKYYKVGQIFGLSILNDGDHPSYLSEVSYEILSKQNNVEFELDNVHDQMYHKTFKRT